MRRVFEYLFVKKDPVLMAMPHRRHIGFALMVVGIVTMLVGITELTGGI